MIQVTLNLYPKLKSGDVNLEFLLVDGKRARVKYISDQLVPVEDLHAFTLDGSVRVLAKEYNKTLKGLVDMYLPIIGEAYAELRFSGSEVSEASLHEEVGRILRERPVCEIVVPDREETLMERYKRFSQEFADREQLTEANRRRLNVLGNKLNRFLHVKEMPVLRVYEFTTEMMADFENFIYDEYLYVANPKYAALYPPEEYKTFPHSRLSRATVHSMFVYFREFWAELVSEGELSCSPTEGYVEANFKSRNHLVELFGTPVSLNREEIQKILSTPVPERLLEIRDFFILQCCLGIKERDLLDLTMENVSVYRGIPYIHYVPRSRLIKKKTQKRRRKGIPEIRVPLIRVAFDIVKRSRLKFDLTGGEVYLKLRTQLLRHCGVVGLIEVYDMNRSEVVTVPFCDGPLKNIAQTSFLRLMYELVGDRHMSWDGFRGTDALYRMSVWPLSDYRLRLNRIFGQDNFRVDEDLNIIKGDPFEENEPVVYKEESAEMSYSKVGPAYLITSLAPLPGKDVRQEARISIRQWEPLKNPRRVLVYGDQFVPFMDGLEPKYRDAIDAGLLLVALFPSVPELFVMDFGGGLFALLTDFPGREYCTFFCEGGEDIVVLRSEFMRDRSHRKRLPATAATLARKVMKDYLADKLSVENYDPVLVEHCGPAGSLFRKEKLDKAMSMYSGQILHRVWKGAGFSTEAFAEHSGTYYRVLLPNRIGDWLLRLKNLCRLLESLELRAEIVRSQ